MKAIKSSSRIGVPLLVSLLLTVSSTACLAQATVASSRTVGTEVLRTKPGRFAEAAGMTPSMPSAAASAREQRAVTTPVTTAMPVTKLLFELRGSDMNLKNAFLRWAEEHRQQVTWRLSNEVPLDAVGAITATSLVDAMTQVAVAFQDKKEPFVIREYDNTIVILPLWSVRP